MNRQQNEERIRRAKEEIAEDAKTIDPRTAEMVWWYAQVVDPYGLEQEIAPEAYCVGREYFLVDRSRGTNAVLVSDVRAAHPEIPDEQWEELMAAAAERDNSPDPLQRERTSPCVVATKQKTRSTRFKRARGC